MDFDRSYGPIPTPPSEVKNTSQLDRQTFEVSSELARLGNAPVAGALLLGPALLGCILVAGALAAAVVQGYWSVVPVLGILGSLLVMFGMGAGLRLVGRLKELEGRTVTVTALTLELPDSVIRFSDIRRLEGTGAHLAVHCVDGERLRLGRMPGLEAALREALGRFAVERGATAGSERERARVDGLRGMDGAL